MAAAGQTLVRIALGWLTVATLGACALVGCDDKSGNAGQSTAASAAKPRSKAAGDATERLNKRCEQLGQACGQKDEHKKKIGDACKQLAWGQADKGCVEQAIAAYDCYEKEICSGDERIWAFDDFRVLTERHKKCVAERKKAHDCVTGGKDE